MEDAAKRRSKQRILDAPDAIIALVVEVETVPVSSTHWFRAVKV